MRTKDIYIIIVLCCIISHSCTKKEYIDIDVAPQLELSIVDNDGKKQNGANIKLFANEQDFQSNANIIHSGNSDVNGIHLFENLEETIYYFYIEKGKMNNYYKEVTFYSALRKNEIRKIKCTIR